MNRQFFLDATPAAARLMMWMASTTELTLSGEIIELASRDQLDWSTIDCELGPVDKAAVQFVIDSKFRCGLPVPIGDEGRARVIVDTALRLAGIAPEDTVHLHNIEKHGFLDLVPHRRKVLLVDIGRHKDVTALAGKLFPRVIVYGGMTLQYTFLGQAKQVSTGDTMGMLLNPQVETDCKNSRYKRTEPRTMLAMGVFPFLSPLDNLGLVPKKMKGVEIVTLEDSEEA